VLSFTVVPETAWEDASTAIVTIRNNNADAPEFSARISIGYESNE
jgi:hypothetical protein